MRAPASPSCVSARKAWSICAKGLGAIPPACGACRRPRRAHLREPAHARQLAGRGLLLRARAHPGL
jgi:hypothetical protein